MDILDTVEANRYFGKYDGIDNETARVRSRSQCCGRPLFPNGILRKNIDEDIAVDKDRRHSVTPGQGHDLLCGQLPGGFTSHMFDQFLAPRLSGRSRFYPEKPHLSGAFMDKFDLCVGNEPRRLSDIDRDGDLSLGRNAHGLILIPYFTK
jgi:hypothetical protein